MLQKQLDRIYATLAAEEQRTTFSFVIEGVSLAPGEKLVMVGDIDELGNGDLNRGLILSKSELADIYSKVITLKFDRVPAWYLVIAKEGDEGLIENKRSALNYLKSNNKFIHLKDPF
jgi:hypothetical protein